MGDFVKSVTQGAGVSCGAMIGIAFGCIAICAITALVLTGGG